ncbi:MAG TPA: hypothetical protein VF585_01145 [Chthoniobacterales bacterium]
MRKLTKLEKTLSVGLACTIFLLANLFGISALLRQRRALQLDALTLASARDESNIWLEQKDKWLTRKAWLEKPQPRSTQPQAAQTTFFEELQRSARSRNLAIEEQTFGEVAENKYFQSISVRMKLTGTLENTTRWLASLQSPELFQAITSYTLKSEKDPPNVNLELEIAKYYLPNNGS